MQRWKISALVLLVCLLLAAAGYTAYQKNTRSSITQSKGAPMSYQGNIVKDAQNNQDFRRVVFTGTNSQLVVMSIPPGGDV